MEHLLNVVMQERYPQTCRVCKQEKMIDEFTKDSYRPTGYSNRCKKCNATHSSQYLVQKKNGEIPDRKGKTNIPVTPKNRENYGLYFKNVVLATWAAPEIPKQESIQIALPIEQENIKSTPPIEQENTKSTPPIEQGFFQDHRSSGPLGLPENERFIGLPGHGEDHKFGYYTLSRALFTRTKRKSYCHPKRRCDHCVLFLKSADPANPNGRKYAEGCSERPPEKIKIVKKRPLSEPPKEEPPTKKMTSDLEIVSPPINITKKETPMQMNIPFACVPMQSEILKNVCLRCKQIKNTRDFPLILAKNTFTISRICHICCTE